ncbi:hypothetical protein [Corynebacterium falsenii]|uniref:hypothetical protein n=1 Tax=Corynebacterium falsenii TaxID=108486 RepID=UPI003FD2F46C
MTVPAPFLTRVVCFFIDLWVLQIIVSLCEFGVSKADSGFTLATNVKEAIVFALLLAIRLYGESTGKNISSKRFFATTVKIDGQGGMRVANVVKRNSWIFLAIALPLINPGLAGTSMFVVLLLWLTSTRDPMKRTLTDLWASAEVVTRDSPAERPSRRKGKVE